MTIARTDKVLCRRRGGGCKDNLFPEVFYELSRESARMGGLLRTSLVTSIPKRSTTIVGNLIDRLMKFHYRKKYHFKYCMVQQSCP